MQSTPRKKCALKSFHMRNLLYKNLKKKINEKEIENLSLVGTAAFCTDALKTLKVKLATK